MINSKLTTIIIVGILALYLISSTIFGVYMYKNYSRVEANQLTLLDQTKGINKDKQLVLTPADFKHAIDSSTNAMMKHLDIKVKNLEQAVKATATGHAEIQTAVKDTNIIQNNILVPAKSFVYTSKYMDLKGVVTKDSANVTWNGRDYLTLLLYWQREGKFLPFIFGHKVYRAAIEGENPYMKYVIDQNIKIQKR